jgi:hypothetical protein
MGMVKNQGAQVKLDRWTQFNLSREDQQFFQAFASADSEASIVKNVPMGALDQARAVIRRMERLSGRRTYVMFRGRKNRYHGQATTWKQDADRFSVYFR